MLKISGIWKFLKMLRHPMVRDWYVIGRFKFGCTGMQWVVLLLMMMHATAIEGSETFEFIYATPEKNTASQLVRAILPGARSGNMLRGPSRVSMAKPHPARAVFPWCVFI